jgi:small subunit ribosomal protein S4
LLLLEEALDNSAYVTNGDVVNIASYHLKPGDKVAVREKSKSLDAIERSLSNSSHVYEWITWNK